MIIKKIWHINSNKLTALYNPLLNFRLIFLNKKIIHHSLGTDNKSVDLTFDNGEYNMIFSENNIGNLLDKNNKNILSIEKGKTPFFFYIFFIINFLVPIFTFEAPSHWYSFFLITLVEKFLSTSTILKTKYKVLLCFILSGFLYYFSIKSFILF